MSLNAAKYAKCETYYSGTPAAAAEEMDTRWPQQRPQQG